MNPDMWASLLCNIKCEERGLSSLDVITKGTFGSASKTERICKNCEKSFNTIFSSPREDTSSCFETNKTLVEAFLKIGKGMLLWKCLLWQLASTPWTRKHSQNV